MSLSAHWHRGDLVRRLGYTFSAVLSVVIVSISSGKEVWADSYFFEEIDKSLVSIGGRATYIDLSLIHI